MTGSSDGPALGPHLVAELVRHGLTVATAESLTGGLVCAELVAVPGASSVVRGGVVAYASDLKTSLLGVDPDLVRERGTIDGEVAAQMALGVVRATGADVGLATTGNAGPEASEGQPVGRVWIAVATPEGVTTQRLDLAGDRAAVRDGAVAAVLSHAVARLAEEAGSPGR